MGAEAPESVSLVAVVGWTDVRLICDHEVILPDVVSNLSGHRPIVCLRQPGEPRSLEEGLVLLVVHHVAKFSSQSDAHLIYFTL